MLTRRAAGRIYNWDCCIGRNGISGTGFREPIDFAVGSDRSLYVISRGTEFNPSQGVTKCTLDHELVWDDRGPGFGGGKSPWPTAIAVDSHENIYIADESTNTLVIYDKGGELLSSWGTAGSADGELGGPSGLAFDGDDGLYIADSLNHRVQKFTKEGRFLSNWGSQGSGEGQFNMPWGITVDKEGNVYVADWKNDRVQKFTSEGQYLATFGSSGADDGELSRPSRIAIDSEGDVYVTDWGNFRLNIYAPDGVFITAFIGDAETLSPWAQALVDANPDCLKARRRTDLTPEWRFGRPIAVQVDDDGRIIVLEAQRHRMQIYVKERNFVDAQFNL
jgi:tripartite motif-containing protein 71